tara:strand:- start:1461 stop:2318 length:858 start_codon:yes stop_codon:yes gene_type:complete
MFIKIYKNNITVNYMKNIISWTQTYGSDRILNMQLLEYDVIGNYLRNKCKYIIFSFHNCPDHIYQESTKILTKLYNKDKLILLQFNNCSYLECYKNIIIKCKELNCTDICQIQDDQHGINSNENTNNLKDLDVIIETYKINYDIKYLHIFGDEGKPKSNLIPIDTFKINNVEFYKYDSRDFKKYSEYIYAWNDGTYIININMIEKLLSTRHMPHDVWRMELFLKNILDNNQIYRYGTNKVLFKASNLYGRNVNKKISPEENLFRFFGETNCWNSHIKNLIKDRLR